MTAGELSGKRVLVTNAATAAGLAAGRALAEAGCEVVMADVRRFPFGLRSRFAARVLRLNGATFRDYEDALLRAAREERPDILLPMSTGCVAAVARNGERFRELTAVNAPAWDAFRAACNKAACTDRCAALGIPAPRRLTIGEATSILAEGGAEARVVLKPAYDAGGAEGVRYLRAGDDPAAEVRRAEADTGPAMLQEFVPGPADAMRTVVVVFDGSGNLTAAFSLRKRRHYPLTGGITVSAHSIAERAVVELVLPFFVDTGWRGPAEVELKWDARDGCHKVIEINPRFPGYMGFARRCGLDLAVVAARASLADPPALPFPSYRAGAGHMIPQLLLQAVWGELRGGRPWRAVLRGAQEEWRGATSDTGEILRHDPVAFLGRVGLELQRYLPPARAQRGAPIPPGELLV
jgi:predicted ATP-grasp superfamily ATP-dependent carboligase